MISRFSILFPAVLLAACTAYVPVPMPVPGGSTPGTQQVGGSGTPVSTANNSSAAGQSRNQSLALTLGEEKGLATFLKDQPELLLPGAIIWVSTDEKIVSVDGGTGAIKALKQGNAIILGISKADPNRKFTFDVTIGDSRSVLLIRVEPGRPQIKSGEKVKLTAEVRLADGQVNSNVIWSSSDDTIATVNDTTGEVTGLKRGKVTILATYGADHKFKGAAEVTVGDVSSSNPPPVASASPLIFGPDATPLPDATTTSEPIHVGPNTSGPSKAPVIAGSQIVAVQAPRSDSSNGAILELDGYSLFRPEVAMLGFENGDEIIQRGEKVLLALKVRNTGTALTKGVVVELATAASNIEFDYHSLSIPSSRFFAERAWLSFGDIPAGSTKTPYLQFVLITVGSNVELGATIPITLRVKDEFGNLWLQDLKLQLP